jgi:hypothetical protein
MDKYNPQAPPPRHSQPPPGLGFASMPSLFWNGVGSLLSNSPRPLPAERSHETLPHSPQQILLVPPPRAAAAAPTSPHGAPPRPPASPSPRCASIVPFSDSCCPSDYFLGAFAAPTVRTNPQPPNPQFLAPTSAPTSYPHGRVAQTCQKPGAWRLDEPFASSALVGWALLRYRQQDVSCGHSRSSPTRAERYAVEGVNRLTSSPRLRPIAEPMLKRVPWGVALPHSTSAGQMR